MKPNPRLLLLVLCASAAGVLLLTAGEPPNVPARKSVPPTPAPRLPDETLRVLLQNGHYTDTILMRFQSLGTMHEEYLRRFETAPGFGDSRMIRLPRSNEIRFPRTNELALPEMTYTIKLPDLISLEDAPIVYRSSSYSMVGMVALTNRATRPHLPKRALTVEETKAVKELRAGRDFATVPIKVLAPRKASPAADRLTMQEVPGLLAVGALRAKATCAKCHGCAEGTLLGAFSYQLVPVRDMPTPIPVPATVPAPASTLTSLLR